MSSDSPRPHEGRAPEPQPLSGRRLLLAAWPGLALAAALRAALHASTRGEPLAMGADRVVYDELAAALAAGRLDARLLFVSPLYPHWLAALPAPEWSAVAQALAGLATLAALAALALATGASLRAARLTGVVFALSASPLFLETQIYPTTLAGAAIALAAALYAGAARTARARHATVLAFASGLALAAGVLFAQGSVLIPFALLLAAPLRPRVRSVWLLLPILLALSATSLRNARIEPGFHPLGVNGGVTFAHGNVIGSQGRYQPLPGSDASKRHQHLQARRSAEAALGRALRWSEVDAHWRGHTLGELARDPAGAAKLWLIKAWRSASEDSIPLDASLRYARSRAPALYAAPLGFQALLLLAAFAWLRGRRWPREVVAIVLATAITCVLFFPDERYRLPATLALCVPAGLGVDAWLGMRSSARRVLIAALAVAVVVLGLLRPAEPGELEIAAANHALNLEWSGRQAEALALQQRLYRSHPTAQAGHAIARMQLAQGAVEAALARIDQALALFPEDSALHNDRGVALRRLGRSEQTRSAFQAALGAPAPVPEAHLNLAELAESEHRFDEAAQHYAAYVRELPEAWHAWQSLARARVASGAPDGAVADALAHARALAGDSPERAARAHNVEGLWRERQGDLAGARSAFRRALELAPELASARRHLARLERSQPRPDPPAHESR